MQFIDMTDFNKDKNCFNEKLRESSEHLRCDTCPIGLAAYEINGEPYQYNVIIALNNLNLDSNDNRSCYRLAQYVNRKAKLKTWNKLCK